MRSWTAFAAAPPYRPECSSRSPLRTCSWKPTSPRSPVVIAGRWASTMWPSKTMAAANSPSMVARWSTTERPPISSSPSDSTRTLTGSSAGRGQVERRAQQGVEVALVVGDAAGVQPPVAHGRARTRGSSTARRRPAATGRRSGRRRSRSGRPPRDAGMMPSTIGLRYCGSDVCVPPIRSAIQSAAARSSSGWAPSLEIDSIRSSSQSCCQLRLSDRRGSGCACHGRCRSASARSAPAGCRARR